jgi:hypothetical protein
MTGRLCYDAALWDSKGCVDWVPRFFDLVDFMVVDMDPCQQTSIILGKPFLKSVRATIDKMRGIINIKVDTVHEKFTYHPKNLACYC